MPERVDFSCAPLSAETQLLSSSSTQVDRVLSSPNARVPSGLSYWVGRVTECEWLTIKYLSPRTEWPELPSSLRGLSFLVPKLSSVRVYYWVAWVDRVSSGPSVRVPSDPSVRVLSGLSAKWPECPSSNFHVGWIAECLSWLRLSELSYWV